MTITIVFENGSSVILKGTPEAPIKYSVGEIFSAEDSGTSGWIHHRKFGQRLTDARKLDRFHHMFSETGIKQLTFTPTSNAKER